MNAETVHYISFSIKRILRCYPGFQSEGKQHRITRPQILETSDWETVEANILAGPRRSKMEVKIDILQAISEGAGRPTHIMYRSNLSWAVMRNFIKALEEQGLVSASDIEGRKNYVLTQKGIRVLETYANVRRQLEAPQLIATVG